METKDIVKEFFEEQFKNTSRFFLYKDKQLLKEGRYSEFAEEQMGKAKHIFWSVAFAVVLCSGYGITSLIEYGNNPNAFDLSIGISAWGGACTLSGICHKRVLHCQKLDDPVFEAY